MVVGVNVPHGIAVLVSYPDPSGARLCHAPADAYAEGAAETDMP
jgi:hypothetical protein